MAFGGLKGTLTGNGGSVTNPSALTGSVAVAIGDLVVVAFGQQTALTATGATDNLGNTYTAQNAGTDAGVATGRMFYSRVSVAGTLTTINVAATGSTNDYAGLAAVIEGPFAAPPIDVNIANATTDVTSPFTCPATGTLAFADEVVVCWGAAPQSTVWAASSPLLLAGNANNVSNIKVAIGYKVVSVTTTTSPEFTAAANPSVIVLGTASFIAAIAGTGAMADASAAVSGSGLSESSGAGTPASQAAAASGVGLSSSSGDGVLAAAASSVSGEGTVESATISGTGSLLAAVSAASGVGISESTGTGALASASSEQSGAGLSVSTGSGTLAAAVSSISGAGLSESAGTGELLAGGSAAAGEGNVASDEIIGSGDLAAAASAVSGVGVSSVGLVEFVPSPTLLPTVTTRRSGGFLGRVQSTTRRKPATERDAIGGPGHLGSRRLRQGPRAVALRQSNPARSGFLGRRRT